MINVPRPTARCKSLRRQAKACSFSCGGSLQLDEAQTRCRAASAPRTGTTRHPSWCLRAARPSTAVPIGAPRRGASVIVRRAVLCSKNSDRQAPSSWCRGRNMERIASSLAQAGSRVRCRRHVRLAPKKKKKKKKKKRNNAERGHLGSAPMGQGRVVMGLVFFPRGGSAYVVRYLSPALARAGWSVSLAVGSLGLPGEETHARRSSTVSTSTSLTSPMRSARSRPAATRSRPRCRCIPRTRTAPVLRTCCSRRCGPRSPSISARWDAPLLAAGADRADVFHLHHLTPQLDAAHRRWPEVPLVAHLHGTELKMIEAIEARSRARGRPGRDARDHARGRQRRRR